MNILLEKIKKLIANSLNIDIEKINEESNLIQDLNADSLDVVEIVMEVENDFNIQIIDEEMPKSILVKDIVNYVKKATNTQFAKSKIKNI